MSIDLAMVIGAIVEMAVEGVWDAARRTEIVRRVLKSVGFVTPPSGFDDTYVFTLVQYGVGKPKEILDLFRDNFVREAFHHEFFEGDETRFQQEIDTFLETNSSGKTLMAAEIDLHAEFEEFWTIFHSIIDNTRPLYQVKHEQREEAFFQETALNLEKILDRLDRPQTSPIVIDLSNLQSAFYDASTPLRKCVNLVGGKYAPIDRPEVEEIVQWAQTHPPHEQIAILVDKPGSGKTVAMAQILTRLETTDTTTVLGIKADYLSGVRTAHDLQEKLELQESVQDCIKRATKEQPCIVLIDQLDALSVSLSQDYRTLDLIHQLILRLSQMANVTVIASCREFDLNYDPKLSSLKPNIQKKFVLKPLTPDQIRVPLGSIGINIDALSQRTQALLSLPLHLNLYAELVVNAGLDSSEEVYSLHQLYDELWKRQITFVQPPVPNAKNAIDSLVERMQSQRQLVAPFGILDNYPETALYLERINFIRSEKGNYVFYHQTLFDYCYARRFVEEGRWISEVILNSPQGLFERSQMLQVLAYLRASNDSEYSKEVNKLFSSIELRFHLRFLLIEWLGSLAQLSTIERQIARALLKNIEDQVYFFRAARGNAAWFDLLNDGFLKSLLYGGDLAKVSQPVLSFFQSVISERTDPILDLLSPYRSITGWNKAIKDCLFRLENWEDNKAIAVFCDLISENINSQDIWERHCLYRMAASNPKEAAKALRLYFEKAFELLKLELKAALEENDSEKDAVQGMLFDMQITRPFHIFLDEYELKKAFGFLANYAPFELVENFLTWLIDTVEFFAYSSSSENHYPSDRLFSLDVHRHYDDDPDDPTGDTFLDSFSKALQFVAKTNPKQFKEIAKILIPLEHETPQCLLAWSYLADPEEYSHDIFTFLTTDKRRFDIGNSEYESRLLVGAAYKYGDAKQRETLEETILNMRPEWEIRGRHVGLTQLQFLASIPSDLLSANASRRLQELLRRFPDVDLSRTISRAEIRSIGSPISQNQLDNITDENLIKLMKKYDDSTSWGMPREKFFEGGIVEFSRAIADKAKEQPDRFYRLAKKFDDTISVSYITAIMSGLALSEVNATLLYETAINFIPRFIDRGRSGFCSAIRRRAEDNVPDILLDIMSEWVLNDPDPDPTNSRFSNEQFKHEWYQIGINSTRSSALEAVSDCALKKDPPQFQRMFELVGKAVKDASPAVGACALHCIARLVEYDRHRAIALAEEVLTYHPALLNDEFTNHHFLNWASFYHFDRFGPFVDMMMKSSLDFVRRNGAAMGCQAALRNDEAKRFEEIAINGDVFMRTGAADTYAKYLRIPERREHCIEKLIILMQDSEKTVLDEVASCFANLSPEDLDSLRDFIYKFLASPALSAGTNWYLVQYIKSVASHEHDLTLDVTSAILDLVRRGTATDFWYRDVVSFPLAVYNRSSDNVVTQRRAIELFEEFLRLGFDEAKQALEQWDEHRNWAFLFN